jgi:Effector Associated Constant Component 1
VLAVAIRTFPEFLRARRAMVSIKIKVKDREIELTAENVEDALPAVLRALDD